MSTLIFWYRLVRLERATSYERIYVVMLRLLELLENIVRAWIFGINLQIRIKGERPVFNVQITVTVGVAKRTSLEEPGAKNETKGTRERLKTQGAKSHEWFEAE